MKHFARIAATALAALACVAALCLCACSEEEVFPYSWENLSFSNGRAIYSDEGYAALTGVDVSEHQGFVDWAAVAADGIDFAVVRIGYRGNTEGGLSTDEYFPYNVSHAQAAGLATCGYFYTQATTVEEAEEEADFVLELLRDNPMGGFIAWDFEPGNGGRLYGITRQDATACARAFCSRIQAAGYRPMIYANEADLEYFEEELLNEYPIWLAKYTQNAPTNSIAFECWQYSGSGTVGGFDRSVDLNLWLLPQSQDD